MFVALVAAVVAGPNANARTLSQSQDIQPDGRYQWEYSADNGIAAEESGYGGQVATGRASWISPEGIPISFSYTADENGYQAVGDAIPVGPPTPPLIARALEYIRTQGPYVDNYSARAAVPTYQQTFPSKFSGFKRF